MLNIISHRRSANENTFFRTTKIKANSTKCWWGSELLELWYAGEIIKWCRHFRNLSASYKAKHILLYYNIEVPLLSAYAKENMFTKRCHLFIMVQNCKQPNCLLTYWLVSKFWYIHTMEYNSSVFKKKNELWVYEQYRWILKTFHLCSRNSKTDKNGKNQKVVAQVGELAGKWEGELSCLMEKVILFCECVCDCQSSLSGNLGSLYLLISNYKWKSIKMYENILQRDQFSEVD